MSIEAISWALNVPVGANEKVMLLGLANHAWPDGTNSYPSLDTLAKYGHCDRSTARRNVRLLEKAGWIAEDGQGPKGTVKWRLAMGEPIPSLPPMEPKKGGWQNATLFDQGGGTCASGGVAPVPPEPSLEPSKEEEPSVPRSEQADEVWIHYCQKISDRQTYDEKRKRIVRNAVKKFGVEKCKRAIDGLAISKWHNGENPSGKKYLEVRYALKGIGDESDEERIEKMISWADEHDGRKPKANARQNRVLIDALGHVRSGRTLGDTESSIYKTSMEMLNRAYVDVERSLERKQVVFREDIDS